MVEPVSNTTVPNAVAKVASVEHRQGVEATTQDRDVPVSREEAETKKDKDREGRRLAALSELQDEILSQAGVDNAHLRISEDKVSGRYVYETVHNDTGEVMKQYPAEQLLRSIRFLRVMEGIMVDRRA